MEIQRARKMRIGWIVGGGLGILTLIEFAIAITMTSPLAPLSVIAFAKAGLIAEYFMHFSQIWSREGGH